MRVLSLFDGMSCGRFVLDKLNVPVDCYIASEVDKHAITVASGRYPTTVQMGDVRFVRQLCEVGAVSNIDLLIGGSPCQNLSFAGKQNGFSVDIHSLEEYKRLVAEGFEFKGQSYLFWEYVWIKELLQPKWFMLENVRMKKEYLKIFDDVTGVEGVFINSALVSAQNRQRYYWCNWQVDQPEDRGLLLRDIIESGAVDREKSYCIDANYYKGGSVENYKRKKRQILGIAETENGFRPYKDDGRKGSLSEIGTIATPNHRSQTITVAHIPKVTLTGAAIRGRRLSDDGKRKDYSDLQIEQRVELRKDGKSNCLTTVQKDTVVAFTQSECRLMVAEPLTYRKLTVTECERLQGLPDGYTEGVSNTQRYKMLGNGWQCDTIEHIFMQAIVRGALV